MSSLKKISGLSLGFLAACLGMGYAFHRMFVYKMSENPIFLEAMEAVRRHSGVISFLGEPISSKNPVLANNGMLLSGYSDVQVRVSGPKSDGIVFLKVIEEEKNKVVVDSIQLQIGNDYSKRLVVRKSKNEKPEVKTEVCNAVKVVLQCSLRLTILIFVFILQQSSS